MGLPNKTTNVATVSPLSSTDHIGYFEIDGTLEAFKGDTGATGPKGEHGVVGAKSDAGTSVAEIKLVKDVSGTTTI